MQTPTQTLESDKLVTHPVEFAGRQLMVSNFAVDHLINDSLVNEHVWEAWQLNLMSRIIKPDFTCIDVGANVGINAMFAGLLCPRGRVLAYEPFPVIFRVLQQNIEQNGLRNVKAINKGLSNSKTTLEMVTDLRSVGGAHITDVQFSPDEYATTTAHFARLDEEMHEQGVKKIDFIKIDVEGHEMKVLAGGEEYLRHPDLQMTIEYSPIQHFRSSLGSGSFADRPLFEKVRSWFRHVFFLNRDKTMQEMTDWHLLRRRLMGGYFVDDLYCVNSISPEVKPLIVNGPAAAAHVETFEQKIGPVIITSYNRDRDGWGMGDDYNPATISMTVDGPPGHMLCLKFDPMYRKHLPNGNSYPTWPVWVMVGPASQSLDLLDAPREMRIQTTGAPLHITMQSDNRTRAAAYLGNPNDPRQIGFRFDITECSV